MLNCPGCNLPIDADDLAGQLVACPRCRREFVMPGMRHLSPVTPPPMLHEPQFIAERVSPQTVVIVPQSRPAKRLEASGWFTRAFAATGGYLVATWLAGLVGLVLLFAFGYYLIGEAVWTGPAAVRSAVADQRTLPAKAAAQSRKKLKELGIVEIATDADAFRRDGKVYFAGRGKDVSGQLHSFIVVHEVVDFQNRTEWHLESVVIDDVEEYARPH